MQRRDIARLVTAAAGGAALFAAEPALALNPLEYSDNGANAFSRGGAWLATATDPIATHYNPAALATLRSSISVDARLNYNKVCFTRTDENGDPAPVYGSGAEPVGFYKEACNDRREFPLTVPALSMAWRATDRLGFGLAVVPPSAYSTANNAWSAVAPATGPNGEEIMLPGPYRYMTLGNQSTILFPTASVGYEVLDNLRIGAGFVSGIAIINVHTGGISLSDPNLPADVIVQDSYSNLQVRDLFIPGVVASVHWSATPMIDVALWGRYSDAIRAHQGDLIVQTFHYRPSGNALNPVCPNDESCPGAFSNSFSGDIVDKFEYPFPPPEVRAGVRFHLPRSGAPVSFVAGEPYEVRDPLNDDLFDIELDGSYTWNSAAEVITVRFRHDAAQGAGPSLFPVGNLPPIVDQATGFKDSVGFRLGGQYNVLQNKLGLMAGTWLETESQKPELLNVDPVGAMRGGIGGGLVFRQDFIDLTFGYQYHWSAGLETQNGLRRANNGATQESGKAWSINNEPIDLPPEDRREFRSYHIINNGSVTQRAHAFTLGGIVRF